MNMMTLHRMDRPFVVETDFYSEPIRRYDLLRYGEEDYLKVLPELKELYPAHWEELSVTKERYPLDPDYETYERLARDGILHVITAREGGLLAGYVMAMVIPNLHYRTCRMAVEDVYYLRPSHRKGYTGIRLFQAFERRMRELGVNRIVITTKVHLDNSRLFEYLGYNFFEKGFTKLIG